MSLKICESLQRILPYNVRNVITSAWSTNSFRGLKSFSNLPRAKGVPHLGSTTYFEAAGGQTYMHKYIDDIHKSHGPIFIANLHSKDIVFISNADANIQMFRSEGKYPMRHIPEPWRIYQLDSGKNRGLYFMDDQSWLKARSIFNDLILKQDSMACHVKRVNQVCKNFIEIWKDDEPKNLKHQIYCWNVECIGEIAFGKNLGYIETLKRGISKEHGEKREFVDVLYQVYVESAKLIDVKSIQDLKLENALPWTRFCEAMEKMLKYGDYYVQKAIENCKASNPSKSIKASIVYKALIEENMEEETIKGVVTDLFLGSPDTTSHTALWALYLLGKNPEVAKKAREEVYSFLKREQTLTLENTTKIPYINGIIKETTRLYSPAPFINRTLSTDAELCGYLIPAGSTVMSSLLTMGRDPENYSDPLEFQPERWSLSRKSLQHDKKVLNKKAHTPFALGARSCVGKKVAELDLSLLLINILTNFEWTVDEEVEPILRLITVPDKDFILNLKKLEE